jgi:hypothetical protein
MPKVLVFAIKGFSSKAFLNEFTLERGYYTIDSTMWALSIRIYSIDSIADLVDSQETLKPKKKSIISLDLYGNAEMRKLYVLAKKIFSSYIVNEEAALNIIEKTSSQFSKIISCWSTLCKTMSCRNKRTKELTGRNVTRRVERNCYLIGLPPSCH